MKLELDRKSSEANVFSMKSRRNVANSGQKYCFTKRKNPLTSDFLLCFVLSTRNTTACWSRWRRGDQKMHKWMSRTEARTQIVQ